MWPRPPAEAFQILTSLKPEVIQAVRQHFIPERVSGGDWLGIKGAGTSNFYFTQKKHKKSMAALRFGWEVLQVVLVDSLTSLVGV